MRSRALAALLLLLGSTSCFATGPKFNDYDPIFEGEARLYVYRPAAFTNSGGKISFLLNGKALTTLRNDGYVSVSLPPGRHTLRAEWPCGFGMVCFDPVSRDFRLEAGRAMFCAYFTESNAVVMTWRLECSDDRDAHYGVRNCKREPFEPGMGWLP